MKELEQEKRAIREQTCFDGSSSTYTSLKRGLSQGGKRKEIIEGANLLEKGRIERPALWYRSKGEVQKHRGRVLFTNGQSADVGERAKRRLPQQKEGQGYMRKAHTVAQGGKSPAHVKGCREPSGDMSRMWGEAGTVEQERNKKRN